MFFQAVFVAAVLVLERTWAGWVHNDIARRIDLKKTIPTHSLIPRDVDPGTLYPSHNIAVPIDHFHNESKYEPHSDEKFNLRYWFDASYYAPGGPVIVLQSGETAGTDRLPYLQKGILHQLASATRGIGVVLEHRYYGDSMPMPDLSTESLRFLTTEQALADEVYFANNIVFPGLEDCDLTAPGTAFIGYGGSYAGAFNAFLRKLYPDVFWGAISSSGVTEAIYDYWQYYEPIRVYGPPDCILTQQKLTNVVDNILLPGKCDEHTIRLLKDAFGLGNLTHNDDFANVLSGGIGTWQGRNWDPAVGDPSFEQYCGNLTSDAVLYPQTKGLYHTVNRLLVAGGYGNETKVLNTRMLNYIGYVNLTAVSTCDDTQFNCFSNYNKTFYQQDDISQVWRSWPYQYCSQWGFLQTGSGVPNTILPLISRTLDLNYMSIVCRDAFDITTPPDTMAIKQYGGYDICYTRLAFIDGEQDPWRVATPHASPFVAGVKNRTSTTSEPFRLIAGAVHHWDENGLFPNETTAKLPPPPIKEVQKAERDFVVEWMKEWKEKEWK